MPHRVFALGRRVDLDLVRGREPFQFLGEALAEARKHGRPARKHDVCKQIRADVLVALIDRPCKTPQ